MVIIGMEKSGKILENCNADLENASHDFNVKQFDIVIVKIKRRNCCPTVWK